MYIVVWYDDCESFTSQFKTEAEAREYMAKHNLDSECGEGMILVRVIEERR